MFNKKKKSQKNIDHQDSILDVLSDEVVIMFGELRKKGKVNTAWKSRWCELSFLEEGLILSYYLSKLNKKLCGTIKTTDIYALKVINYDEKEFEDYNLPQGIDNNNTPELSDKYSFALCTLSREFVLAAPNKTDFIGWIEIFNKYIYGHIIYEGFLLLKKEKTTNTWKQRYFVLNEYKQFKYYEDVDKKVFCGAISLSEVNEITNGKVYDDSHKFTFNLYSKKNKRKWVCCAKSMPERQKWQQKIKQIRSNEEIRIIGQNDILSDDDILSDRDIFSDVDIMSDNEEDTDIKMSDCSDISTCKSLDRVSEALLFFSTIIDKSLTDENTMNLLLNYFENDGKSILNDYGHLLCVHLDQETQEENDNIFAIIHNKCSKYINCSLDNCKHYTRNNRNRCEPNTKVVENNNNLLSIYTDILDTIHCYFLHSYDTGFRLIKNYKNEQKNDDTDKDNEMQYIQKEIKSKRKRLEMIRGLDCIQKTKFVIDISVDDTNDEKSADSVLYSFGQKFYYNDKDKNNENEDVSQWGLDVRHNRGYKIKDWYVGKKYENIKQEILTNKLYTLNATEYNDTVIKAVKFVKDSVILRNYATKNVDKDVYVDADDTINAEHVLCLLLYTDYTNLQYHFSKTFRKINSKETNEQFKQRKREFYWWSKILIQTVQSFGTDMIRSNVN
eukprot:449099_1